MIIGEKHFDCDKHTYVMGILNVTPDSFSDGGSYSDVEDAVRRVDSMIREGADIIDIGGESTRPGAVAVDAAEELNRVIPVIEAIRARFDIPISLDTYKSEVANAGLRAGVNLINDIWGLKYDDNMARVIAKADAAVCIMHNRRPVGEKSDGTADYGYNNIVIDVENDLSDSIHLASLAGIDNDKIIIDPGIGFAKDVSQNLALIEALNEFKNLGYPVLLGCSRKSIIGKVLELETSDRLNGTLATTAWAVMKHAAFVRVHDIKANVEVIKMTEAIMKGV